MPRVRAHDERATRFRCVGAVYYLLLTMFVIAPVIPIFFEASLESTPTPTGRLATIDATLETLERLYTTHFQAASPAGDSVVELCGKVEKRRAEEQELVSLATLRSKFGEDELASESCVRCRYNAVLQALLSADRSAQQSTTVERSPCSSLRDLLSDAFERSHTRHAVRLYSRHLAPWGALKLAWYGARDVAVHGFAPLRSVLTAVRNASRHETHSSGRPPSVIQGLQLAAHSVVACAAQSPVSMCPPLPALAFRKGADLLLKGNVVDESKRPLPFNEFVKLVATSIADRAAASNAKYNEEHMKEGVCDKC